MDEALNVQSLHVTFGLGKKKIFAVRGIDLVLAKGECLGIVGESGSGKSVTALAIMGLLGNDAEVKGSVSLDGEDLTSLSKDEKRAIRGKKIAMIFQEPSRSFDPIYSIEKTFEETFRAHNPEISREEARAKALKLMEEVHIPQAGERIKNFPHQFSGGMLQRLMIALALANDPEVLIADEPTTALDVTIQAQIVGILKELQKSRGLSLLFISHDLSLVGQIADRIQVMYGGLALESGPAGEVLEHPRSPYTSALVRALPTVGSHYSQNPLQTIKGTVPDPSRPEPGCPFLPRCPMAEAQCGSEIPTMIIEKSPAGLVSFRCLFMGIKP